MTNDLRIADAPLLVDVSGEEKLPTGGYGNYSATINQLAVFTKDSLKLADNDFVNSATNVVDNKIKIHVDDDVNPHNTTKAQVGLGEVDNTADLDKPVSVYQRTAIDEKVAKTSIVDNLTTDDSTKVLSSKQGKALQDTKANKVDVYTKSEVYDKSETLTVLREDQYVVTESGRTQRERNSDFVLLSDFCKLNSTDETDGFLSAVALAKAFNKKLVAYSGTIKISQDINLRMVDFDLSGLTIRCKDNSKVIIGWDAGNAISKTVHLGTVYRDTGFKLLPSQIDYPSVQMLGAKNYTTHFVAIDRMELYVSTNPNTYPNDASIAYCYFYGALLVLHEYVTDPLYASGEQADGAGSANQWINSNMWYVARMMGVKIGGSYRHNGNVYHNPTFENATSFIQIDSGNKNHFLNIRGENYPTVIFGESTSGNVVERCWYSASSNINSFPNYTDKGRQNKYICAQSELAQVFDVIHLATDTLSLFNGHVGNYAGRAVTHRAIKGRDAGRVIYETAPFDVDSKDILYFSCDSITGDRSQYAVRVYLYDANGDLILDADDTWRSGANFGDSFLTSGFFLGSFSSSGQTWFHLLGIGLERVKRMSVMLLNTSSGTSQSRNIRITLSSWRDKYSLINTRIKPHENYNFVTSKPTECIAPFGTRISNIDGTYYFVAFSLKTKITEVNNNLTIRCVSTSVSGIGSVRIGDLVGIDLQDGSTYWTKISGISSGLLTLETQSSANINIDDTVYVTRLL